MVRTLAVGTVVALAAAMSTSAPPDAQQRPLPQWYVEICADVSTC